MEPVRKFKSIEQNEVNILLNKFFLAYEIPSWFLSKEKNNSQ